MAINDYHQGALTYVPIHPTPPIGISSRETFEFKKEATDKEDARAHNHYFRNVSGLDYVDVYRIIELFQVTDPCLQHIIKKALCAGLRGHKDFNRDLQDIIDTAQRRLEMLDEDAARTK